MQYKELTDLAQLDTIEQASHNKPQVIYKHSTRCSISIGVANQLTQNWNETEMAVADTWYLDLLSYRPISNAIAEKFGVRHESPQVLVIKNGKVVFHTSHFSISYEALFKEVEAAV